MTSEFYVATRDIPFGDPGRNVFAHRAGDKVPAANVKANGWEEYVATPTSQAGKKAAAGAAGEEASS